ncbi:MAG: AMP-binding protein [Opitutae bacterium]
MINPYSKVLTTWESSESPKGDFLLDYALQSLELLKKNKSIQLTEDQPLPVITKDKNITLSFLSGGTTRWPEKIKHTPATIRSAVNGLIERIGGGPINSLCCLPLWHVGGWMQLERAWASGGKILFCDYRDLITTNFEDKIIDQWISLVPAQLQELLKSKHGVGNLKRAKGIFVGGAGMNARQIEVCRSLQLNICPCYGSSETAGMVSLLESGSFLSGGEGVGAPLPHAQIRINDEQGCLEIKCTSLCISRGRKKFARNSWWLSPDLGNFDQSGNLVIAGRADRTINTGGEKVHPFVLEKILYATGIVEQCMVYGEPDEKWGQQVVACVCPGSIDLEHLRNLVEHQLVGPMKPKVWKVMDRLPLSEMGKLPIK